MQGDRPLPANATIEEKKWVQAPLRTQLSDLGQNPQIAGLENLMSVYL